MMYRILQRANKSLSKLVVVFLVFSFLVTPLAPVFADMTDSAPGSTSDSLVAPAPATTTSTIDAPVVTPDSLVTDTPNTTPSTDPTSPDAPVITPSDPAITTGNGNTTLPDPTNPGASPAPFPSSLQSAAAAPGANVKTSNLSPSTNQSQMKPIIPESDPTTGALVYDYPVLVPPGRNGMQPDITLRYNSQDTAQDSIVGFGWSLNIPYIARVNKKGTNTLFTDNYFTSSLSGELVNISGNNYRTKVENGDFLKYVFAAGTWTATDKSGTVYIFGAQSTTRQDNPSDSTQIYKWMLERVQDNNGNFITYNYFKDAGQIYPNTIIYTNNGANSGIFSVVFSREARPDIMQSSSAGFPATTNYRVSQIQTLINGVWAHTYALTYATQNLLPRSFLASIVESGKTNSMVTTLLATTIAYQGQTPGWAANAGFVIPKRFQDDSGNPEATQIADVNGDGLQDIIFSGNEWHTLPDGTSVFGTHNRIWINTGSTWVLDSSWAAPVPFYMDNSNVDSGARLADINADGLADFLFSGYEWDALTSLYVWHNRVYINNGHGWVVDSSWSIPVPFLNFFSSYSDNGSRISDVNADGLPDIIYAPGGQTPKVYINTGVGFVLDINWVFPIPFTIVSGLTQGVELSDVNGDGLTDVLFTGYDWNHWDANANSYVWVKQVWLNNGHGWTLNNSWSIPENFEDAGFHATGTRIADVNGDNLPDLLFSGYEWDSSANAYIWKNRVRINTGNGWVLDDSWSIPVALENLVNDNGVKIADVNGDGLPDILVATSADVNNATTKVYINNTPKIGYLIKINSNKGAVSTIAYKPSTQYKDNVGNLLNPNLPFIIQTVSEITATDPLNNVASTDTYIYTNGYYYFDAANPINRKFANFGTITKTDSAGNVAKTYFHQGNGLYSAQGEYQDDYFKIGRVYRTEQYDGARNLYSKIINKFDDVDLSNAAKFVELADVINFTYDGGALHKDTAESYAYDSVTGNLTQKIQYGQVLANDNGTFADRGIDSFTTNYSYASDGANMVDFPSQTTVTDQNGAVVKQSKFYYDNLAQGSVAKGNLTKQEDLKSGVSYIANQKTYNSYGLVTSLTDPLNNVTRYSYDVNNLYPASIINAKNQSQQFMYDYATGQVTQKTDANGRVFQYSYDGLGRLVSELQPDLAAPASLITKNTYTYADTPNAVSIKKSSYLDDSTVSDSYTYFDGLGRKIQDRQEAENGNYSTKDYGYNNLGQLQKESLPYFSAGSAKTSPNADATLYANYAYDPMGRVIVSANSTGTTLHNYNQWKVTTTDANGNIKEYTKDAYGNLIQVDEHNGGNIYSTYYSYDGLGDLVKLTDAQGNVRNFTYDNLGRQLSAQDLHAVGDITFGGYTYSYDNAGNLLSKTDSSSQSVNYTYDILQRPLTEDQSTTTGIDTVYTYDGGVDGVGRLTGIQNLTSAKTYNYNALGLLAKEDTTISATHYATNYAYDRQGNQTLITNPDNSQIKYSYNGAGFLDQIQKKLPGDVNFSNVVNNFDYLPTGQIMLQQNTNGTTTTNTYDATKQYRLIRKLTTTTAVPPLVPPGPISFAPNSSPIAGVSLPFVIASAARQSNIGTQIASKILAMTRMDIIPQSLNFLKTLTSSIGSFFSIPAAFAISPPAITGFVASPATIVKGKSATLLWAVSGDSATTLTIDNGVGSVLGKASLVVAPTQTTTYTLTARNAAGTATRQVTVTVIQPVIISAFSADPAVITVGQTTILSWTLSGSAPTTLSINNPIGNVLGKSSVTISPTQTTVYTLTATNLAGTTTKQFTITVNPIVMFPSITTFVAIPASILAGQSSVLSWTLAGGAATTLSINNSIGSVLGKNSITVLPTTNTTYILTAANSAGTVTKQVTVAVNPPPPVISTFTANPLSISVIGRAVTLSWILSGGTPTALSIDNSQGSVLGTTSRIIIPGITQTTTYTLTASNAGGIATKQVTVTVNLPLAAPTISPNGGTFTSPQTITLATVTTGAQIYYTIDGSLPTSTSLVYSNSFTLSSSATVKAIAIKSGSPNSAVASASFVITIPTAPIWSGQNLQDLNYTYDNVGNITQITDNSNTNSKKVSTYTYDSLYRLTSTVVTGSNDSAKNYIESYTYDALGNILTHTINGTTSTYTYAGNMGNSFANPHAVTSIVAGAATNYTYDKQGNMASDGTTAYTFNPKNQLAKVTPGTGVTAATINYVYDSTGQRISKSQGTTFTLYPSKSYNVDDTGKTTVNIFTPLGMIGEIDTPQGGTPAVYNVATDNLGGTGITTDALGVPIEVQSYSAFGNSTLNDKSSTFDSQRKYIGEISDSETGLNYFNARYYDGNLERFISEDLSFWNFDNDYLLDPQQWNSYAYARNNPISLKDADGKKVSEVQPILPKNGSVYNYGNTIDIYRGITANSRGNLSPYDYKHNAMQCAPLASAFLNSQYGFRLYIGSAIDYGNAKVLNDKLAETKTPGSFSVYQNGGNVMPQENDIITWINKNESNGHVGVIVEVAKDLYDQGGMVYTLEQNVQSNNALYAQSFSRDKNGEYTVSPSQAHPGLDVKSWSRYSGQQSIPATSWQIPMAFPKTKTPIK